MLKEDNPGFVNFPISENINRKNIGKTLVYIIAYDIQDLSDNPYELSNIKLNKPGDIIYDDVSNKSTNMSIDDLIKLKEEEGNIYFSDSDDRSINLTTCICVGWSDSIYDLNDNIGFWSASFRDLTNEGKRLYYSIKKLHNNKEVRILTFINL